MRHCVVLLTIAIGLLMATGAQAGLDAAFWNGGTQGGVPGDYMEFTGWLRNTSSENPLYVNSWSVNPGTTNFSGNGISFDTIGSWWIRPYQYGTDTKGAYRGDPAGTYGGDPIDFQDPYIPLAINGTLDGTGNYLDTFSGRLFAAHTTTATPIGTYSGEFVLSGGIDSSAAGTLATLPFTLDVIGDYGFTLTLLDPVQTGGPGYTATYVHRYYNGGSQPLLVSSMGVGGTDVPGCTFNFGTWVSQVDPGATIDAPIFTETINDGAPVGTYQGGSDITGGYYPGDTHQFTAAPEWQLNVTDVPAVPEPSALAGLLTGLGGLGTLIARRKRS